MRNLFKSGALLFAVTCLAFSQEEEDFGTMNILNLVSSETSCEVTLGGKSVMPDGLTSGNTTGWFYVPAGQHQMNIEHPDFGNASGPVAIPKDSTQVVVIFLQPSARKKPDGTPMPPDLRIRRFPAFETARGFALKAVSMLEEPTRYTIGPNTFTFEKATPIDIPSWNGGGFTIAHGNETIATVTNREDRGSYYVFFSPNPDGKHLAGIVLSNPIIAPKP